MFVKRLLPLVTILLVFTPQTHAMLATAARTTTASRTRQLVTSNILRNHLPGARSFSIQPDGSNDNPLILLTPFVLGLAVVTIDDHLRARATLQREEERIRKSNEESAQRWEWKQNRIARARAEGRDPYAIPPRHGARC